MFNPGQQVICINGKFDELLAINPSINVPIEDKIYTVRERFNFIGMQGITLEGIHNKPVKGSKIEPNFNVNRFTTLLQSQELVVEEELAIAA